MIKAFMAGRTDDLGRELAQEANEIINDLSEKYDREHVEFMFLLANELLCEPMKEVLKKRALISAAGEVGRIAADMTIDHYSKLGMRADELAEELDEEDE